MMNSVKHLWFIVVLCLLMLIGPRYVFLKELYWFQQCMESRVCYRCGC